MNKKLLIVKAKIGKCSYIIEMENKTIDEIIQEIALQHDTQPERIEIIGIMNKKNSWPESMIKEFVKTAPTLEEFKKQYLHSPH